MMKRILSLLLAISMIVSVGAFAVMAADVFPDVAGEHNNSEAIKYYAQAGVINGYPDGTFGPDKPITRAEFVKMLMVYAGNEKANTEGVVTGFPDVDAAEGKEAHWAHPHIKTALDLKIINGYPDGTFKPDDNVKYEEALKMMVCYLGRESVAKDRADAANIPVYPEGYIRVANENLMNTNLSSVLGGNASRADVAQILYNSKDIKKVSSTSTPGVIIGGSTGGSTGGGGGGGGGSTITYTLDESVIMQRSWSGSRDGVVVAAAKSNANGNKEQYFIEGDETGLLTRDGRRNTIMEYQLIVKMDDPVAGYSYILFTDDTKRNEYYNYLGQHVEVKFTYDGGWDKFYIKGLDTLRDTNTMDTIDSKKIRVDETNAYNENAAQQGYYGIRYYVNETDSDYSTLKLPLDLNSLKVIYNEKLVNTAETPLTINDFLPDNGTISYVKAGKNGDYRLIKITDFDTYVVGRTVSTQPRGIDDKYRKAADGTTPLRLVLDDREESEVELIIKDSAGAKKKFSNIGLGNVLTVSASKCGKYVDVTYHTKTLSRQKIFATSETQGIAFGSNKSKYYPYSEYYKKYVAGGLDIQNDDYVNVGLNAKEEIVWIEETEPTYLIGYLKDAEISEENEDTIKVEIITSNNMFKDQYKLTKSTKVGSASVVDGEYVAATKSKYSDMDDLMDFLRAQAAIINAGKTEGGYSMNATVSQPVRYVLNGNNIEMLETMALDMDNKFTGTSLTYLQGTDKFSGTIGGRPVEIAASPNATYIFVPNNRGWAHTVYKAGTSSELVNYGQYNVEPYFVPTANGVKRQVFVIYNENIVAQPNHRSETIIVERTQQTDVSGSMVYKIYPKQGYGTSTTSYNTDVADSINAYVLDANFQRMRDENGNFVKREVKSGDVIRFGYTPGKSIKNLEILFDASEPLASRKEIAYNTRGNEIDSNDMEFEPYYYGRVGLVTYIPANPDFCELSVGVGETSRLFSVNYSTQKVLLNTYAADGTSTWEVKTMDDLNVGDMVYVWQQYSNKLNFKYIYAVRYETDLMGEYEAENAPQPPVPGTGGGSEPSTPGTGEPTDPDNGGSEPSAPGTGEPTDPDNGGSEPTTPGTDEPTDPDNSGSEPSQPDNE